MMNGGLCVTNIDDGLLLPNADHNSSSFAASQGKDALVSLTAKRCSTLISQTSILAKHQSRLSSLWLLVSAIIVIVLVEYSWKILVKYCYVHSKPFKLQNGRHPFDIVHACKFVNDVFIEECHTNSVWWMGVVCSW